MNIALVGSWRVGKISGKRIQVFEYSIVGMLELWMVPVFVYIAPEIEPIVPVFVAPTICHPDISVAQDPVSIVPVFVAPVYVSPVELFSCEPVELVPVLVISITMIPELIIPESDTTDSVFVLPVLVVPVHSCDMGFGGFCSIFDSVSVAPVLILPVSLSTGRIILQSASVVVR